MRGAFRRMSLGQSNDAGGEDGTGGTGTKVPVGLCNNQPSDLLATVFSETFGSLGWGGIRA